MVVTQSGIVDVCRVCLLHHVVMRDLFHEDDVISLSTKAMTLANVKVNVNLHSFLSIL